MLHNEDLTVLESGPENEEFTATLERVITWKMQPGLYCGDGVRLSFDDDPKHGHQWNLSVFDSSLSVRDWVYLHTNLPWESIPCFSSIQE